MSNLLKLYTFQIKDMSLKISYSKVSKILKQAPLTLSLKRKG